MKMEKRMKIDVLDETKSAKSIGFCNQTFYLQNFVLRR